jgi:hypothetical protein
MSHKIKKIKTGIMPGLGGLKDRLAPHALGGSFGFARITARGGMKFW